MFQKKVKKQVIDEVVARAGVRCGHCKKGIAIGAHAITIVSAYNHSKVIIRFCGDVCRNEKEFSLLN